MVKRRREPRSPAPAIPIPPAVQDGWRRRLPMVATILIGGLALLYCLVSVAPTVYFATDPRLDVLGSVITEIRPTVTAWLGVAALVAAAAALAAHVLAGGRVNWLDTVLVLAGCAACALHAPHHVENLLLAANWMAAACLALAACHLCERDRARRLLVVLIAMLLLPLAIGSLWHVWIDHAATVRMFETYEHQFLLGRGWAPGSPQHLLYQRRMASAEVVGPFSLSNVFGSIAAAFTVVAISLSASVRWPRLLLPAIPAACGLIVVLLTRSKGAAAALLLGLGLLALHRLLRARSRAWARRGAGMIALGLVAAAVATVLLRGAAGPPATPDGERSLLFRAQYWQAAWRIVAGGGIGRGAVGTGPAGFHDAYLVHKQPLNPEEVISAHNVVVDYVTMLGLGGAAWSALLLCWLWRSGRAAAGAADDDDEPMAAREALRVDGRHLSWMLLFGVLLFGTQLMFEWPKLLLFERLLAWLFGAGAVIAIAATLLGKGWVHRGWERLGLFAGAAVLLVHGQIEMTFFHPGAAQVAWLVVAVAAARDRPPPSSTAVRWPHLAAPLLLLALAVGVLAPGAVRLSRQQGRLAEAARDLRDGDVDTAIAGIERAIAALPIDPRPYRWHGRLSLERATRLAQAGRAGAAEAVIDQALERLLASRSAGLAEAGLLRSRVQLQYRAADILDQPARRAIAADLASQLVERYPRGVQDHLFAADVLWRAGRTSEARRLYRRCLELDEQAYLDPLKQLPEKELWRVRERAEGTEGGKGRH